MYRNTKYLDRLVCIVDSDYVGSCSTAFSLNNTLLRFNIESHIHECVFCSDLHNLPFQNTEFCLGTSDFDRRCIGIV